MDEEIEGVVMWVASCSDVTVIAVQWGKEGAKWEGKAPNSPVDLHSNPHLWSQAVSSEWKNEIADRSGQNEFPKQGGGAQL